MNKPFLTYFLPLPWHEGRSQVTCRVILSAHPKACWIVTCLVKAQVGTTLFLPRSHGKVLPVHTSVKNTVPR